MTPFRYRVRSFLYLWGYRILMACAFLVLVWVICYAVVGLQYITKT